MSKSEIRNPKSEPFKAARREPSRRELLAHPMVRNYMLFCLVSLFLLVVCLAERDLEWLCLVPSALGCLALLSNWSLGPPVVLLALTVLLGSPSPYVRWRYGDWPPAEMPTLMDLLLCISVLAYVVGHYRLVALMRSIFPPDPRRVLTLSAAKALRHRAPDQVNGWELPLLGFALPLWVGLTVVVWAWVARELSWDELPLGIPPLLWQLLQILWVSLVVLAATGIVANYQRWTTATPEEQLVYLQDQCWRQTRREQSIVNRWLMWARLRAGRKKEAL